MIRHLSRPSLVGFEGASVDSETLPPRLTTPVPEKLRIVIFNQLTYSVAHLLQFINPHVEAKTYALLVGIACIRFEWSRGSAAVRIDYFRVAVYTASAV